jgi:hypothetical protein
MWKRKLEAEKSGSLRYENFSNFSLHRLFTCFGSQFFLSTLFPATLNLLFSRRPERPSFAPGMWQVFPSILTTNTTLCAHTATAQSKSDLALCIIKNAFEFRSDMCQFVYSEPNTAWTVTWLPTSFLISRCDAVIETLSVRLPHQPTGSWTPAMQQRRMCGFSG